MNSHKNLSEELLKADGIDPAGATESERTAFTKMLNEQLTSKSLRPDSRSATKKLVRISNIIKLAAAMFFIIVLLGLHQFRNAITGTAIAWADVTKRFENVHPYKARAHRVFTEAGQEQPFFECDILRYFSPEHGSIEESYVDGELVMLGYCSISEKSALVIFPLDKTYWRFDLNEELLSLAEYINPTNMNGMMKLFGSERCIRLGTRKIDGVTAEGFEVKDVKVLQVPQYLFRPEDVNIRLWVNEETLLPIEIEGEGFIGKGLMTGFKDIIYKEVMYDIEYDPEIDESMFEPYIPDDYRLIDPADIAGKAEFIMLAILPFGGTIIAYKYFKKKKPVISEN